MYEMPTFDYPFIDFKYCGFDVKLRLRSAKIGFDNFDYYPLQLVSVGNHPKQKQIDAAKIEFNRFVFDYGTYNNDINHKMTWYSSKFFWGKVIKVEEDSHYLDRSILEVKLAIDKWYRKYEFHKAEFKQLEQNFK